MNSQHAVLEQMIAPMGTAEFFAEVWDRRSLAFPGQPDKFASLYDVGRDRWIEHAAEIEAATQDELGLQHQFRISGAQVADHFNAGMTICGNVSADPMLAPKLAQFAQELAMVGQPFAKIYASPDQKGFAIHFDAFHVFVCQLHGQKKWRFSSAPALEAPLRSGKLNAKRMPIWTSDLDGVPILADDGLPLPPPEVEAMEEVILKPGDCLYLPPGAWHVASAMGRSVALSISPPRTAVFQLFQKLLEDVLLSRAEWRRDVFSADRESLIPTEVAAMFQARVTQLHEFVGSLDQRMLHRLWRMNALSHHQPNASPEEQAVHEDDRLRHTGELHNYLIAPEKPGGSDAMHYYVGGTEWTLPIRSRKLVEQLALRSDITLADAFGLDADLDRNSVREVIQTLVLAGLLVKHPSG